MTRIFGILIAVLFLSVGHTASAQGLLNRALALMGNADAQFLLGYAYDFGEGVEQDFVEAVKWYRLAAEQGNADAQSSLGYAYYYGEGVEQDFVTAHMWFNIAASNGAEKASVFRDSAERELTRDQISKAQKLAGECVRKKYKDC